MACGKKHDGKGGPISSIMGKLLSRKQKGRGEKYDAARDIILRARKTRKGLAPGNEHTLRSWGQKDYSKLIEMLDKADYIKKNPKKFTSKKPADIRNY